MPLFTWDFRCQFTLSILIPSVGDGHSSLLKSKLGYEQKKKLILGLNLKHVSSSATAAHTLHHTAPYSHSWHVFPPPPATTLEVPTVPCPLSPDACDSSSSVKGAKTTFLPSLKISCTLRSSIYTFFGCSFIEKAVLTYLYFYSTTVS